MFSNKKVSLFKFYSIFPVLTRDDPSTLRKAIVRLMNQISIQQGRMIRFCLIFSEILAKNKIYA